MNRAAFVMLGIGVLVCTGLWGSLAADAEAPCQLPARHAGVIVPVDRIDPAWVCRLQPIVDEYTTANKVGPVLTPLPESVYVYLLDRPPTAAALVNRLDLGLYKAEPRGPRQYWGEDGEGTAGLVELVYQDPTHRVYYLQGSHDSAILPRVTGRAVVFLRMVPVGDDKIGRGSVETTLVAYTKLDHRVLAGLVSLLRPLVGDLIARKLTKGVDAVTKLGWEMKRHPDRVLFEATDPPPLPAEDVAFLAEALASFRPRLTVPAKDQVVP